MSNFLNRFSDRVKRSRRGKIDSWDKKSISGSVHASVGARAPKTVRLMINDMSVLEVPVKVTDDGRLGFKIGMYDVWRFTAKNDRISVFFGDTALTFPDGKIFLNPDRNGKESLDQLRQRFSYGQYFDKAGKIKVRKLTKDRDQIWQDGVMTLYAEVTDVIREVTGSDSFIFSGTLLGYVRDKGFIPHDKDMDCAYLSDKKTEVEVAEEFAALGDALIAAGYCVTPKASCISVRRSSGSNVMVDIAHLFIKSDGNVGFPFGRVGTDAVSVDVFLPVGSGALSGYSVGIPAKPEELVKHIYGQDWQIPDPGFKWSERRQSRDPGPLLDYSQRTRIAMDDLYSRPEITEPSAFALWIADHDSLPPIKEAFDLGCGNGRDLLTLRSVAERVTGIDRSPYAVSAAIQLTTGSSEIEVYQADLLQEGTLSSPEGDFARLFYARLLLNGLTKSEQDTLFESLDAVMKPGDFLAFEHRTTKDEKLKKARFRSFRRFVDTNDLLQRLNELGLEIIHHEEGTGLAPFEHEDPHVVRIIAAMPK